MSTQEIQTEKLSLISWISQLQDISTISRLKSIQYKNVDIPQWQKNIIDHRLGLIDSGEEIFYDFEEAIKEIENEL